MVLLRAIIIALMALPVQAATVTDIIDATTVQLDDGQVVQLQGITAPDGAALEKLVAGKDISLVLAPVPRDRHGRSVGTPVLPNGRSVQSELVSAGQAQVFTLPGNAAIATELLPLEKTARAAKTGLWASTFTVHAPDFVPYGQFAIVEGKVVNVAAVKGTTYVNFGADWKTDFTASMPSWLAKQLQATDWKDKHVRVRGWVQPKNGPLIAVTHAEQIEVLDTLPPPVKKPRKPRAKKEKKSDGQ